MKDQLQTQVEDQDRILRAQDAYIKNEAQSYLRQARPGGNSVIEEWRLFCVKEKSIYATLNLFEGNMNLRASCWYPAADEDQIRAMLIRQSSAHQGAGASAVLVSNKTAHTKRPPTYIRKNEFTAIFQDLVDTYGLPRYGEANPMILTTVTFPFLFGIMYGDIGHGFLLFLVGLGLLWKGEDIKYTLPAIYQGRYIITMMGFFAIYAGFLYNDIFSVGLDLFGTRWKDGAKQGEFITMEPLFDDKNTGGDGPYPFGVDPAWHGAHNELIFMNSLKMKISVVIGVTQMTVGLLLRFSNAIYESNSIDLFCECVPMMVFMLCFFGFMDYMIIYKWVTPMTNPPSIINSMIAMGMWQEDPDAMFGMEIVRILMILTMLTVPVMLIPKPVLLTMKHQAQTRHSHGHMTLTDEECGELDVHGEEDGHEFDVGEMTIHQIIETIEYVLGTVSHTASYLRLWALSLAHQQLSLVFYDKTLLSAMGMSFPANMIALIVAFAVWFGCTVGILLGMDVMECFLHTLRLHWVEFQSKFYRADGYAFEPYRHKDILEEEEK